MTIWIWIKLAKPDIWWYILFLGRLIRKSLKMFVSDNQWHYILVPSTWSGSAGSPVCNSYLLITTVYWGTVDIGLAKEPLVMVLRVTDLEGFDLYHLSPRCSTIGTGMQSKWPRRAGTSSRIQVEGLLQRTISILRYKPATSTHLLHNFKDF